MCVAALDELHEPRRGQPCGDSAVPLREGGPTSLLELRRAGRSLVRKRRFELAAITRQRPALHFVVCRHIEDEGCGRAVVDEVVADPLWIPRLAFNRVTPEARIEHRLGQDAARSPVIRMAIVPVWDGDHPWLGSSNKGRSARHMSGAAADAAIGPPEIFAPRGPQHGASLFRFGEALFGRPVAAQLASREIAKTDAMTQRGMLGERRAKSDLEIVRMRPEREHVSVHVPTARG